MKTSPTILRSIFHVLVSLPLLGLSACGGGSGGSSGGGGTKTPASDTSASLAQQIQALERSGQLPLLDRSSDIAGPDANQNGIRDDIDAWITALPISDAQKKAAQQAARVRQAELLVDLGDTAELDRLGDLSMASIVCLGDVFMPDRQRGRDLSSNIVAITFNTKDRAQRYVAYNRAVSGSAGQVPEGNTCEP